jgi:hypothetical protein
MLPCVWKIVTEVLENSSRAACDLYPEDGVGRRWRQQVPPKRFLAPTGHYGFVIRYILINIFAAMKSSNVVQIYNCSFRMRDEILNPCKTAGRIIVLCTLT